MAEFDLDRDDRNNGYGVDFVDFVTIGHDASGIRRAPVAVHRARQARKNRLALHMSTIIGILRQNRGYAWAYGACHQESPIAARHSSGTYGRLSKVARACGTASSLRVSRTRRSMSNSA